MLAVDDRAKDSSGNGGGGEDRFKDGCGISRSPSLLSRRAVIQTSVMI